MENFEDIPWKFVLNKIKNIFAKKEIVFIVCKGLIKIPEESEREKLIQENHASAVGEHKGINKTYHRLRQNYYWNTMKKDTLSRLH